MAFDYSGLVSTFASIIDEFEMGTIAIARKTATANPDDPWDYSISESETAVNAVVSGVNSKRIDGVSIQDGDLYVIISSEDVSTPINDSDLFLIDGKYYQIIKIIKAPPAGVAIVYRFQVRSF